MADEPKPGWRNIFHDIDNFPKVAALAIVTVFVVVTTAVGFGIATAYVLYTGKLPPVGTDVYFQHWLDFITYGLIGGTVLGLGIHRATTKADVIRAEAETQGKVATTTTTVVPGANTTSTTTSVPTDTDQDKP